MTREKIHSLLLSECSWATLDSEAQVCYIEMRKQQIIKMHIENVFPIKEPGERGGDPKKWFTKLTPKDRNHDGKIRASSREELELKIITHFLESQKTNNVRNLLEKAVDSSSDTGTRSLQRFDKRLPSLADLDISEMNKDVIWTALETLVKSKVTQKEFNQSITCLNKIADYCRYENINVCDIRGIVADYRHFKLTGKHNFVCKKKKARDLYFSHEETKKIILHALQNPSAKSLAIAMLITTGLRAGELLALELKDVDLKDDVLSIHQIEDSKTQEIHDYVKENKCREVYLSEDAHKIVEACIKLRKEVNSESPFIFLNSFSEDGKMHLRALDDYMRTFIHEKILGLDETREARSPHDCRRTYATLEYLNGTDIYDISHQLGHSSIKQTEEYIQEIVDSVLRKNRLKGLGLGLDADCTQLVK